MNLLEKRIRERFPEEQIEVLSYTRMKDDAKVRCKICNKEYSLKAENFIRATKTCICQNCAKTKNLKLKYQEKINKRFPQEKIVITEFNGAKDKIKLKCLNCGTEMKLDYGQNIFLSHKKRVCPHCFPNKKEALQNTLNNFIENFVPNNKFFTNFEFPERINSDTLIKAVCVICGKENYKTLYDYQKGKGCTCQCTNTKLSLEEYKKRIGIGYTPVSEYKGLDHSILMKHEDCGFIFKCSARHVSCPKCKGSNGEKQIRHWLKMNNFIFVEQYSVNIKNHLLRFDFYLPDYDIFIEFQGRQHYEPVDFFGGEIAFQKQKEYDNLKRKWAKNKLIEIKYTDDILLKLNEQVTRTIRESSGNLLEKEEDMF